MRLGGGGAGTDEVEDVRGAAPEMPRSGSRDAFFSSSLTRTCMACAQTVS